MKSSVDQLSTKEKEALALLYDSEGYKALEKVCRLEIAGLGQDALGSQNHEDTRFLAGQAYMATKLPRLIRELSKKSDKS